MSLKKVETEIETHDFVISYATIGALISRYTPAYLKTQLFLVLIVGCDFLMQMLQ
jgi:hypothetical protein